MNTFFRWINSSQIVTLCSLFSSVCHIYFHVRNIFNLISISAGLTALNNRDYYCDQQYKSNKSCYTNSRPKVGQIIRSYEKLLPPFIGGRKYSELKLKVHICNSIIFRFYNNYSICTNIHRNIATSWKTLVLRIYCDRCICSWVSPKHI
jgi:hypothetical protein